MRRKILLPVLVFLLYTAIPNHASAQQCTYHSISMNNDTTIQVVDCDFPIKASTSDLLSDQNQFLQQFQVWRQTQQVLLVSPGTTGIKKTYFVMTQSAFDLLNDERKAAIRKHPDLYRITQ